MATHDLSEVLALAVLIGSRSSELATNGDYFRGK